MPVFLSGWPDYDEFMDGDEQSIERKIWFKAKKLAKKRNKPVFLPMDPIALLDRFDEAKDQKVAGIARSMLIKVAAAMYWQKSDSTGYPSARYTSSHFKRAIIQILSNCSFPLANDGS